ncbi:hypothetical protein OF83DRAFT_461098 [Amylostereum chailletii]|nr:hypothetical protein OF83DRAFT_461098 [Amylostereum chailletii]
MASPVPSSSRAIVQRRRASRRASSDSPHSTGSSSSDALGTLTNSQYAVAYATFLLPLSLRAILKMSPPIGLSPFGSNTCPHRVITISIEAKDLDRMTLLALKEYLPVCALVLLEELEDHPACDNEELVKELQEAGDSPRRPANSFMVFRSHLSCTVNRGGEDVTHVPDMSRRDRTKELWGKDRPETAELRSYYMAVGEILAACHRKLFPGYNYATQLKATKTKNASKVEGSAKVTKNKSSKTKKGKAKQSGTEGLMGEGSKNLQNEGRTVAGSLQQHVDLGFVNVLNPAPANLNGPLISSTSLGRGASIAPFPSVAQAGPSTYPNVLSQPQAQASYSRSPFTGPYIPPNIFAVPPQFQQTTPSRLSSEEFRSMYDVVRAAPYTMGPSFNNAGFEGNIHQSGPVQALVRGPVTPRDMWPNTTINGVVHKPMTTGPWREPLADITQFFAHPIASFGDEYPSAGTLFPTIPELVHGSSSLADPNTYIQQSQQYSSTPMNAQAGPSSSSLYPEHALSPLPAYPYADGGSEDAYATESPPPYDEYIDYSACTTETQQY